MDYREKEHKSPEEVKRERERKTETNERTNYKIIVEAQDEVRLGVPGNSQLCTTTLL